jgi:hypothetical protein
VVFADEAVFIEPLLAGGYVVDRDLGPGGYGAAGGYGRLGRDGPVRFREASRRGGQVVDESSSARYCDSGRSPFVDPRYLRSEGGESQ